MQAQELDSLQEKASELYLQGEFRQALAVWRELLEHAPDHERAQEGARLCEVLAEQMEAAAEAPQIDRAEALPGLEDDPLDIDLSALNLGGGAAPAATAPTIPELPDPARQAEGIDLGDLQETETIALVSEEAEATASATAAIELRQRVGELLAEARQAQQNGDNEHALSLVARVFILDEENATARELQEELAPEPEPAAKEETGEDLLGHLADAKIEELPNLDLAELPGLELNALPDIDLDANDGGATVEAPPADDLLLMEDVAALEDTVIEPVAEEAPPPPIVAKKTTLPTKPLLLAAGIIVVAAAAFIGWQQLSGPPPEQGATVPPAPSSAVSGMDAQPAAPAEGPAAVAAPPESNEPLDTVIQRARAAFEAGDYSLSILAYNEVVRRDPGNVEAREQLIVAGERYHERKETLEQWERAIQLFNQGDYRSSLVLLYRLPGDEDPERVARYSRNGWYNMGLQSLQAGDCKAARGHFREARTVDPADPGILQALQLCSDCLAGDKPSSYYRTVNQLGYRGLDD